MNSQGEGVSTSSRQAATLRMIAATSAAPTVVATASAVSEAVVPVVIAALVGLQHLHSALVEMAMTLHEGNGCVAGHHEEVQGDELRGQGEPGVEQRSHRDSGVREPDLSDCTA